MNQVYRIGLLVVLYAVTVFFFEAARPKKDSTEDPAASLVVPISKRPAPPQQRLAYGLEAERTVSNLSALEEERARRQRAVRDMPAARHQAQFAAQKPWAAVVNSNLARFRELVRQAQQVRDGSVACTICDGFSYMSCVMCHDHDGKCGPCGGTGRQASSEYCPTCIGTGKCYLCSGSGKMFCPFCDDGVVHATLQVPSSFPPAR